MNNLSLYLSSSFLQPIRMIIRLVNLNRFQQARMLDKLSPILGHVLDQCLRQVERVDGRFLVELTGLF